MSIGHIVCHCAALAFTLSLSGVALAESPSRPFDPCPPSHGIAGSGYRDMSERLIAEEASGTATRGAARAGGYRDSLVRFSTAERTGPVRTPNKVVGGGYRDSIARFPGTFEPETPRHAMLRCGRIDSI